MPSHFKFKEYCPRVFQNLRERFGIDDQYYAVSNDMPCVSVFNLVFEPCIHLTCFLTKMVVLTGKMFFTLGIVLQNDALAAVLVLAV